MYRIALASSSRATLFSARRLPASRAPFHTSPVAAKTVTEKVKTVASDVNLKVGRTLASGIEKGQQAAETTKQAVGGSSASEVADNVNKSAGSGLASAVEKGEQATAKAQEMMGTASKKSKENVNVLEEKGQQAATNARQGTEQVKEDIEREMRK